MQAATAYDQGLKFASAGRHFEAIECFEQALAASPSDTKVLFALGNTARALGQPAMARQFFSKVLALEPGRIEALVNLANLLRLEGQFEAARALLEPALARCPQSPELHLTMGAAWSESGDNDKAAIHYRAALAASPNYAPALSNLADLLADSADHEGARTLYGQALKADPGNAQIRLNRAMLHLMTGNLKDGWRDYAARAEVLGKVPVAEQPLAAWSGGPLKKIRLLVRSEQGVGDELMFASLFGELITRAKRDDGSVILECEKRLAPLFARSFPDAAVHPAEHKSIGGRVIADYGWLKSQGGANAAVLMGSLPRYLRKSLGAFPADHAFLKPDLGEQVRWHGVFAGLGPSPAIGICWRSGKSGGHRAVQYAPLAAWAEFLKDLPGALISAQYDASLHEIAELEALSGRRIFVPQGLDQKNEIDRTCAMLSALDVLVSAPTAVSWLGAGAGVKTLKILYGRSWTSFGQAYEPLAPSCVCVMPGTRGNWSDAFSQASAFIARL
ncbi:MAG TPA: tetratricopeptide repeat protein [Rhizomicrobium sp.]|jgi:tetratricopeptide (TPR) repeat protein|nr:tetratricopeptide repeat protein [Rhizomicrobium sp.]